MPGAHAVHYPVRQGREIALVVIVDGSASENDWSREAKPDWLQTTAAAQFAPKLRDILAQAENWRMWPLQKLAPLSSWTNGRVALLGDAAHPLLPFFAQGGGLALEDAAVLAAHIAGTTQPMPIRLKAYEQARRQRAQRVVEASFNNGRIYHLKGAAAVARNAVFATVPPALLMRRFDWLYGWKA
jgi:salicylate hydroxylase